MGTQHVSSVLEGPEAMHHLGEGQTVIAADTDLLVPVQGGHGGDGNVCALFCYTKCTVLILLPWLLHSKLVDMTLPKKWQLSRS